MVRPVPIRFIYFDLDDTLLDHARAERGALADLFQAHRPHMAGRSFEEVHGHYRRINGEVWRAYSSGEIDKQEARSRRFRLLAEAVPITDGSVVRTLPDAYLERYANHWAPLPGAFEAYRRLSELVPVGILTNGFAEIQHAKFRRFPELDRLASAVVISETVGYMKPDRRIFEHAAGLAGTEPGDILYVGDSLRSDVLGGRDAGWNVAWYRPPGHPAGEPPTDFPEEAFRFSDWEELIRRAMSMAGQNPSR
ncbi:MAG: HAD family hydrolase [Rhodothermales bacterium]|nr:HAD family hydrolase [Rhodothermales bacterium]